MNHALSVVWRGLPLAMLVGLAACATSNAAMKQPPLDGSAWTLQALPGSTSALTPDNPPTLRFEAGRALGSDGCNRFSAAAQIDGTRLQLTPRGVSTLRACVGPPQTVAGEFNAALAKAQGYRIEGGTLELLDAAGTPIARFAAQATGLAGTAWVVMGFHNGKSAMVSVLGNSRPTVQFSADGRVSGLATCNRFDGRFSEPTVGAVEIGALAGTRRACESEEMTAQETLFLRALESARSVRREASRLELRRADGALAATLLLAPS